MAEFLDKFIEVRLSEVDRPSRLSFIRAAAIVRVDQASRGPAKTVVYTDRERLFVEESLTEVLAKMAHAAQPQLAVPSAPEGWSFAFDGRVFKTPSEVRDFIRAYRAQAWREGEREGRALERGNPSAIQTPSGRVSAEELAEAFHAAVNPSGSWGRRDSVRETYIGWAETVKRKLGL